jgi:ATP-dependent Clp protease protease subunit
VSSPLSRSQPFPTPQPPDPPPPPRTPWQPDPRLPVPGPVSASASLVLGGPDWLAERLLEQRVLALAGVLDADTVQRAVAELALLDATGDGPVHLRLSGVTVDLDGALTLVDAVDLVGAPVHATCLGTISGAAVALLAVADVRSAGPHALVQLTEPRAPHAIPGREIESRAAQHARQVRQLQERIAAACGRPVDDVVADMRTGRLLTVDEARAYGLLNGPASPRGPDN